MLDKISAYWRLMRFNKPVGILLLLWPTLWGLWIASNGDPTLKNIIIFTLGTILMRAAGCVINDYADRKVDRRVKRTKMRPIATGEISTRAALILFGILCTLAFILVLFLNLLTIALSALAIVLIIIYPFTKRFFFAPQFFLGLAFAWGIPMAFAATVGRITPMAWELYAATLIWIIVYDTQYAMVDKEDDLKIPIYSTAILFGAADRFIIGLLQIIFLGFLVYIGKQFDFTNVYYFAVAITGALFLYQQSLIANREPEECLKAFANNQWVGLVIFCGIWDAFLYT